MWDLNSAERRALAASLVLVGLAGLARVVRAPDPGGLEWRSVGASASGSPRDSVEAALTREARAQTPLAEGERIDVSTAPPEELRRLPGVGPGLASAILRERAARPFTDVADLERVPGIGPATLSRLVAHVRVTPPIGLPAGPSPAAPGRGGPCGGERLDVNTAGAEALTALPGIGPVIAGRIVETRTRLGPFPSVAELARVPGIGPRSIERIAPHACAR